MGEQAGSAKAAAAAQQEERQAWEQARTEELTKLKGQIEAQRLKHGALAAKLAAARREKPQGRRKQEEARKKPPRWPNTWRRGAKC